MLAKSAGVVVCLCLVAGAAYAAGAPSQLLGKSVGVTWNESRVHSAPGGTGTKTVAVSQTLSVYVSTEGHLFSRREGLANRVGGETGRSKGRGRGPDVYGKLENVGGGGQSSSGGARSLRFQGQSLVFDAAFRSGARHVSVDFDGSYASCTAQVIHGRAPGSATTAYRTLSGRNIVVHSMEVSAPTCRIVDGNVFAGN